jgi:predicted nucleic acid-binding Zn ribbon protein
VPKYDFRCLICFAEIEFEKSINDDKTPICCNKTMQKIWTAPGAIFNGSGFYSTDNRKK